MDLGTRKVSALGVGLGAAIGCIGGGYLASKMTRTPANKRILYSGLIQIAAGYLLRNRWPGLALGMIASGAVNVVSVAMTARADALLDGSRFISSTATPLPAAEPNTQRVAMLPADSGGGTAGGATGTSSTTSPLRLAA